MIFGSKSKKIEKDLEDCKLSISNIRKSVDEISKTNEKVIKLLDILEERIDNCKDFDTLSDKIHNLEMDFDSLELNFNDHIKNTEEKDAESERCSGIDASDG